MCRSVRVRLFSFRQGTDHETINILKDKPLKALIIKSPPKEKKVSDEEGERRYEDAKGPDTAGG